MTSLESLLTQSEQLEKRATPRLPDNRYACMDFENHAFEVLPKYIAMLRVAVGAST